MKPHISMIVARSRNGVIGNRGMLPWRLPEELKFFKQTTMGLPIIMGRKTWESIGRPLPGRRNVVITSNPSYSAEGAEVVGSIEEAIKLFSSNDTVMIIGGASIYKQALPLADTVWLTQIDQDFDGDAYFDSLSEEDWKIVWEEEHPATEKETLPYKFMRLERIRNTSY